MVNSFVILMCGFIWLLSHFIVIFDLISILKLIENYSN